MNRTEPIEDLYFNWLYTKVAWSEVVTPSTTYQSLLYTLHCTEFVWRVSGDDNRAEDGRRLRHDFLRESFIRPDETWMFLDCSVLEMLIAFAYRCAFQTTTKSARDWFWIFLQNLGLSEISDSAFSSDGHIIGPVLERFIWRLYDRRGRGGLFPMRMTNHNQREVELWYQFSEYIEDQHID